MSRGRALAVAILLLSYGAVGARQPAVRAAVPLPVPAALIASAANLPSSDPSTLLLHVVRVMYDAPADPGSADGRRRAAIHDAVSHANQKRTEMVPLPLDPSIWRDTILQQPVPDRELVAAILANRDAALLYYGLAALDDQTLAWLGPDRETLQHLRAHAALFATFGRSIHVSAGRVSVPGGEEAEALWTALTGVDPGRPAAFVQRMFRDNDGRLPLLYDSIAHLDERRQRFALGLQLPQPSRDRRLQALLEAFTDEDWQPDARPFSRPGLDASLLLSRIAVTEDGEAAGPMSRGVWDRVFHDDAGAEVPFARIYPGDAPLDTDETQVDAAWLASRIVHAPRKAASRRLDAILFAQRAFRGDVPPESATLVTALRGFASFPALALTLERIGVNDPAMYARAAEYAADLSALAPPDDRRAAIVQYQSALGLVERARRSGALSPASAQVLAASLTNLEPSGDRAYERRIAAWVDDELLAAFPPAAGDSLDPAESTMLSALAGVRPKESAAPTLEWESVRYHVDPVHAALRQLRRVRVMQGGLSLDAALDAVRESPAPDTTPSAIAESHEGTTGAGALGDTLSSILYAAHLADTVGGMAANIARRHDLGLDRISMPNIAWQLPALELRGNITVHGSLLGLEPALARVSGRTFQTQSGSTPQDSVRDRAAAGWVAVRNPSTSTNAARDEISAALARGRARASALTADPAVLDRIAKDAGLSEWRRQALAWTVDRNPVASPSQFTPLELMWLGVPRPSAVDALRDWGVPAGPADPCVCEAALGGFVESGDARGAERLSVQASELSVQVADALAAMRLPATLAPAMLGFAMRDLLDPASPAYSDGSPDLGSPSRPLTRERFSEYVAALTTSGTLVRAVDSARSEAAAR